jgi:hypothetical protein
MRLRLALAPRSGIRNNIGVALQPLPVWFDYDLGEVNHLSGFVCDDHETSTRLEKLGQPKQTAIAAKPGRGQANVACPFWHESGLVVTGPVGRGGRRRSHEGYRFRTSATDALTSSSRTTTSMSESLLM